MPDEINLPKLINEPNRGGLMWMFLCNALFEIAKERGLRELDYDTLPELSGVNSDDIKVSMTINGLEVPLRPVLERWEKHMDEFVAEKARELVNEKVGGIMNKMGDIQSAVDEFLTEKLEKELGIRLKARDQY